MISDLARLYEIACHQRNERAAAMLRSALLSLLHCHPKSIVR